MKFFRTTSNRAMTIMELLMVIAIMAIVAGLVVGLSAVAGEKKKISRAQAELNRLVTLIENYKSKVGMYPPANLAAPEKNSLFYELAGAHRIFGSPYSAGNPGYESQFATIRKSDLQAAFGIDGVVNASDDPTEVKRVLKDIKSDQVAVVWGNAKSFVVPIEGPNGLPNPWKYATGTNAVHNPESFDLWVEIVVRGKTNVIGNWKE
jgi:prepilin-type N-terminal cleavage/methylation domain-containing protein